MKTINDPVFAPSTATFEVKAPNGITYTLRERNGHDESILSRMEDLINRTSMAKFLANVIIGPEKLTPAQVQALPIRVRNYLMLMERCHEFGNKITWTHTFDDKTEVEFEEDLSQYFDCPAYPEGPQMTGKLDSGLGYRMNFLTGEGELKVGLEKAQDDIDVNDRFRVRKLEIQDPNGRWFLIDRFDVLSGKDTRQLRKILADQDPEFNLINTVTNPKTKENETFSFLMVNSFFFP